VAQGRYGAAVNSLQEAVKGFRDLGDRTRNMAEILNTYASALAFAGRGAEAGKILEEAQGLARELKNDTVLAGTLNTEGDVQFFQGNLKAAKDLYEQGLQSAMRAKSQNPILVSKFNLAKVSLAQDQAPSVAGTFRQLAAQANTQGLKTLALQCSIYAAEAMAKGKEARSRAELERLLGQSEKLGAIMETARLQYLLGNSLRLGSNESESASHYREALRILDEIKSEPGAQDLLKRSDLKSLYEEAAHWSSSKSS
jgi:tetratricopeptide (TPR) repeat protein